MYLCNFFNYSNYSKAAAIVSRISGFSGKKQESLIRAQRTSDYVRFPPRLNRDIDGVSDKWIYLPRERGISQSRATKLAAKLRHRARDLFVPDEPMILEIERAKVGESSYYVPRVTGECAVRNAPAEIQIVGISALRSSIRFQSKTKKKPEEKIETHISYINL